LSSFPNRYDNSAAIGFCSTNHLFQSLKIRIENKLFDLSGE
jgi:hypothetical protein